MFGEQTMVMSLIHQWEQLVSKGFLFGNSRQPWNRWPISFDDLYDLFNGDFSWLCYCIDYIVKFPEGRTLRNVLSFRSRLVSHGRTWGLCRMGNQLSSFCAKAMLVYDQFDSCTSQCSLDQGLPASRKWESSSQPGLNEMRLVNDA